MGPATSHPAATGDSCRPQKAEAFSNGKQRKLTRLNFPKYTKIEKLPYQNLAFTHYKYCKSRD